MLVMDVTPAKAESKTPVNFVFCFVCDAGEPREQEERDEKRGGERRKKGGRSGGGVRCCCIYYYYYLYITCIIYIEAVVGVVLAGYRLLLI